MAAPILPRTRDIDIPSIATAYLGPGVTKKTFTKIPWIDHDWPDHVDGTYDDHSLLNHPMTA